MKWVKENWSKTRYFLLLAIAVSMPFGFALKLNNALIIILLAHSLLGSNIQRHYNRLFSPVFLLFGIQLIGLLYGDNLGQGFFDIERKLSFLLIPVALSFAIPRNHVHKVLLGFLYSCIIASASCLGYACWRFFKTGDAAVFFYYELTDLIKMHPIYLAMYICFAIFLLFREWQNNINQLNGAQFLRLLIIFYLILFLVLLSARSELIAFVFIFVFGVIVYAIERNRVFFSLGLIFTVLILISSLVLLFPQVRERLKEAINYNNEYSIDKQWGGRALRILQWDCCIKVIRCNFFLGVGTGDAQDELQACYIKSDYGPLLIYDNLKYNAHNQYFEAAIAHGILGLLILGSSLILPFMYGLKTRDYLLVSFVILFSIACLTESMLEVNKGIVFFTFFSCLLLAKKI